MALYRTYRPGTLAEVVGQPHVTGSLARALDSGRIHHAYLFSGPRGCGKTSTARILARSLNCSAGPTSTPCGTCRSCIELAPNGSGSMDVVELDAATHRGVDDARELRDRAIYAPAASPYKVYIIDEAHQLTSEAANALLKVVEEPPAHLRFVFATTEPDKIIPTIRSRTFNYGFRLVPASELAEHLAKVCRCEGVPAEPAALDVVARAGAGSVRDSLSVLGQLLAASDSEGLTYANVAAALGVTDAALLDDFVSALSRADPAEMFALVDRVMTAGHDPRRFLTDALDRLRDLMIIKVTPRALDSGLVVAPTDLAATLQTQAQLLSLSELSRAADLVSGGLTAVKGATAPRLQLELLCARLALASSDSSASGILARLALLERRFSSANDMASGAPPTPQRQATARTESHSEESVVPPVPVETIVVSQPSDPGQESVKATVHSGGQPPRRPRIGREGAVGTGKAAPAVDNTASRSPSGPRDREVNTRPPQRALPQQQDASEPKSDPAGRESGVDSAAGLNQIRQAWPEILKHLRGLSRVAWMTFDSGTPISLSNGALAVGVADAGRIAFLTRSGHDERLRQSILAVMGLDLTIDVVHCGSETSPRHPVAEKHKSAMKLTMPEADLPVADSSGETAPRAQRAGGNLHAEAAADSRGSHWDEPSSDDPDAGELVGIELLKRELGGRVIEQQDQP